MNLLANHKTGVAKGKQVLFGAGFYIDEIA